MQRVQHSDTFAHSWTPDSAPAAHPRILLFQASLANFNPHAPTAVDFHNNDRAPLLLIAGGKDHISPASVAEANFKLYRRSKAVTDYKEFPDRPHFTVGAPGWEGVADYALSWAVSHGASNHTNDGAAR